MTLVGVRVLKAALVLAMLTLGATALALAIRA